MKNIHVLPTDKPSRLYLTTKEYIFEKEYSLSTDECQNKHIYITSDETAYPYALHYQKEVLKIRAVGANSGELYHDKGFSYPDQCKKIILTTDQDLIKEGVQSIDNEFLEWFVKNPSCDEVWGNKIIPYNFDGLNSVNQDKFLELFYKSELFDEIKYNDVFDWSVNEGKDFLKLFPSYKIFIPKEEPKQETLDEFKKRFANDESNKNIGLNYQDGIYYGIEVGAKWQAERMYSEEEVISFLQQYRYDLSSKITPNLGDTTKQWFEQFKNK